MIYKERRIYGVMSHNVTNNDINYKDSNSNIEVCVKNFCL